MGVLPNLIDAREGLFAYVNSPERDIRNLRAIRRIDRRAQIACSMLRCRRTDARKTAPGPSLMKLLSLLSQG
jgi:hypothetical protein